MVANALLDAPALTPWLESRYGLSSLDCDLIRRGFNDTYRVSAGGDVFILRVYFNHKYYIAGPDDFRNTTKPGIRG